MCVMNKKVSLPAADHKEKAGEETVKPKKKWSSIRAHVSTPQEECCLTRGFRALALLFLILAKITPSTAITAWVAILAKKALSPLLDSSKHGPGSLGILVDLVSPVSGQAPKLDLSKVDSELLCKLGQMSWQTSTYV